jgi:ABC-type multidrug transport system ATPase subunit
VGVPARDQRARHHHHPHDHYLEEAETLCRNIAIINGGLIAERDRMSSLLRKLQAETFVLNLREAVQPCRRCRATSST